MINFVGSMYTHWVKRARASYTIESITLLPFLGGKLTDSGYMLAERNPISP